MSRQDQWLITVTVDGKPLGIFDKLSGGNPSANDTKYRPGGIVPEQSLGGPKTIDDVTVDRLYDLARDHALAKGLGARVGQARMVVSQQPLDPNGAPFGAPIVRGGTLKQVMYPDVDSNAAAASLLQLVMSTDGSIG